VIAIDRSLDAVTPSQRLLLDAVLNRGERQLRAWQAWRDTVDLRDLDAPSQRLVPLLARDLKTLSPDDTMHDFMRGLYRHTWASNRLLWNQARSLLESFDHAGIPTVLLKGVALLPAFGDDWGARPMKDIDVLVPLDRLDDALRILEASGWRPLEDLTFPWVRTRAVAGSHGIGFVNDTGGNLDLHWHLLWQSIGPGADDSVWDWTVPVEIDGRPMQVPHAADTFMQSIVHGATGFAAPPLQWIVDAGFVGRRAMGDDPHTFTERLTVQAQAHGYLSTVRAGLRALQKRVDDEWVGALDDHLSKRRATVVERMRNRPGEGRGSDKALRATARYVAGGVGFRRGVAELLRARLQLDLTRHRPVALLYAATGRSAIAGRLARRLTGSFVVPATTPPGALPAPAALDFTAEATLDQYGGPGWALCDEDGAWTRGAEARLILPLDHSIATGELVIRLELTALRPGTEVDVRVNESRVTRAPVGVDPTTVVARVPAAVTGRFAPLEISLCRVRAFPWRLGVLGLRLRTLELRTASDVTDAHRTADGATPFERPGTPHASPARAQD
jgi:hypothetical protein